MAKKLRALGVKGILITAAKRGYITEVKTKREALRALKRHISRDLFKRLSEIPLTS